MFSSFWIKSHFVSTVIDGSSNAIWEERALDKILSYCKMPLAYLLLSPTKLTSIIYMDTKEKPWYSEKYRIVVETWLFL